MFFGPREARDVVGHGRPHPSDLSFALYDTKEVTVAHASYAVCGVEIAALTPTEAADAVIDGALSGSPFEVHLCNAYTLSLVDGDPKLRESLARADLNLPDGAPVAWLGRRLGVKEPVRGPGLILRVVKAGAVNGALRHYLYGGHAGVADAVAEQLRLRAPGAQVVGCETPPFTELDDEEIAALASRIQATRANIVWVGLGTPRQDYLVPRLGLHLDAAIVPVGAAYDFLAGRVAEAPTWTQGRGLEWLHRLSVEPRRLWRRYLFGNPRFVISAIKHGAR